MQSCETHNTDTLKEERKKDGLETHSGIPVISHPHLSVCMHFLNEQSGPCSWKPTSRFQVFAGPFPVPVVNSVSSQCWYWPSPAEPCCPVIPPRAKFPYFKSAFVILALALITLGPNSHFPFQILTYTTKECIKWKKTNLRKLLLKWSKSMSTTGTFSRILLPFCCFSLPLDPCN